MANAMTKQSVSCHVISLFALDVIMPQTEANALVKRLLAIDGVLSVISAGFYYDDGRRDQESVEETHGLVSYQMPRGRFLDPEQYRETRMEIPAPSKLFGPTAVEVFRCVTKKS